MKSTVEVLREARALYEANPSHAPAQEHPEDGHHCPVTALTQVWLDDRPPAGSQAYRRADDAFAYAVGGVPVPEWNATHTTEEVLAAFDRAIEAEEVAA